MNPKQDYDRMLNDLISGLGRAEAMSVLRIFRLDLLKVTNRSDWEDWTEAQQNKAQLALQAVLAGMPVQYVVSTAWFYGRPFYVNEHVLIPRQETEELVFNCLNKLKKTKPDAAILDIGSGSGCIAVTLAAELPEAHVSAMDIDLNALDVTERNASAMKVDVELLHQDILQPHIWPEGRFDLVVSNPPYISRKELHLMTPSTLRYEPALALFAEGDDPLIFYKAIIAKTYQILAPGGWLAFECNEFFAEQVADKVSKAGFQEVEMISDMQGKMRMVFARKTINL